MGYSRRGMQLRQEIGKFLVNSGFFWDGLGFEFLVFCVLCLGIIVIVVILQEDRGLEGIEVKGRVRELRRQEGVRFIDGREVWSWQRYFNFLVFVIQEIEWLGFKFFIVFILVVLSIVFNSFVGDSLRRCWSGCWRGDAFSVQGVFCCFFQVVYCDVNLFYVKIIFWFF